MYRTAMKKKKAAREKLTKWGKKWSKPVILVSSILYKYFAKLVLDHLEKNK